MNELKLVRTVAVALLLIVFASCVLGTRAEAHEFKVEPYMMVQHISAAFRGEPHNDRAELAMDQVAVCGSVTHTLLPRWEVDICEGVKWGAAFSTEESSSFTVKYFFGRRK